MTDSNESSWSFQCCYPDAAAETPFSISYVIYMWMNSSIKHLLHWVKMRCYNHYNVGRRVLFRKDNKFSRTVVLVLIKTFQNVNSSCVPNYWSRLLVSWQINLFKILEGAEEKWRIQPRAPSATSLTTVSSRHSDLTDDYLCIDNAVYKKCQKISTECLFCILQVHY